MVRGIYNIRTNNIVYSVDTHTYNCINPNNKYMGPIYQEGPNFLRDMSLRKMEGLPREELGILNLIPFPL